MDFFGTLKEFGPFTAPLCFAMAWAIRWLVQDRARLMEKLEAAYEDAKQIRDKRTEDQRAAAKEFREFGDTVTHRLEEWSRTTEKPP